MVHRDRKYETLSGRPAKALVISRRNIQRAKSQARRPFNAAAFQKAQPDADPDAWKKDLVSYTFPGIRYRDSAPLSLEYPRRLLKPADIAPVSMDNITRTESEYQGMTLDYLRRGLAAMSNRFMGTYKHFQTQRPMAAIPNEATVLVSDYGLSCLPSHVFAVFDASDTEFISPSLGGLTSPMSASREVAYYPVHGIVFLAHCSKLPQFKKMKPRLLARVPGTPTQSATTKFSMPVVPLRVPSIKAFTPVLHYVYSLNTEDLLRSLVPGIGQPSPRPVPQMHEPFATIPSLRKDLPRQQRIAHIAKCTVEHFGWDLSPISACALRVEAVWRNAACLGVTDDNFWKTIGLAWEACLAALRLCETESSGKVEGTSQGVSA